MSTINPYSQGWQSSGSALSTYGAVPFSSPNALPTFLSFKFTSFNPTNIALIQRHRHPEVEIRNILERQRTSEMLGLTPDRASRMMTVNGMTLIFMPRDNYIWIYSNASQPELLGRISRAQNAVNLELTGEAIHLGLLEPAVVASFLLQCGRNID
ncbi:hypothetical protein R3P38DRAFT_3321562 [Favolaschia claudopus]|uniref:Uncharacterized protein n=1 Tax=Favolaschia claudopus TaxID=2862362 RepID=A0AAW0AQG8_9AGAR